MDGRLAGGGRHAPPDPEVAVRARWGGSALLVLLGLPLGGAGCASGTAWSALRGPEAETRAVHARLVRFLHAGYASPSNTPVPRAWCLAVGRNSRQALRAGPRIRVDPWLPSARLLGDLQDLRPPVGPISDCVARQGDAEVLRGSELPAVALALSHPVWQGDYARIDALIRESLQVSTRLRCRLGRLRDEWEVMECL